MNKVKNDVRHMENNGSPYSFTGDTIQLKTPRMPRTMDSLDPCIYYFPLYPGLSVPSLDADHRAFHSGPPDSHLQLRFSLLEYLACNSAYQTAVPIPALLRYKWQITLCKFKA